MKNLQKLTALVIAAAISVNGVILPHGEAEAASPGSKVVEFLNRGISAINTGSNRMLVSWRFLADDPTNTVFRLYRDNTLIYTSNQGDATCYLDTAGSSASKYRVDALSGGAVFSSEECKLISNNNYFSVPISPPSNIYAANDITVGDADGDGEYELFIKFDPNNAKDNSQSGVTDKVYIDCVKLNGTRLWRVDLGINIRAGAHYTQMLVADFDLDGKAEMIVKTADGTRDGTGKVIGDANADHRNSGGYILAGPEFLTLFDGQTGAELHTINYKPGRGTVSSWGDNYGNRVDRFLGAVAYLDGVKPSAVTVRGYYTRMTATAYDVVNKKLVEKWAFDTGNSSSAAGYGDGNHNCMPADVDGDGKEEIVLGATCIDDNGKLLWCTNTGHGDALHVSDFLPDRAGQEVWVCHENAPYGVSLFDGKDGSQIFRKDGTGDTGRCAAGNVWSGNDGAEFWGGGGAYNGAGNSISMNRPAENFLIWWDGDLERESLDKTGGNESSAKIDKVNANGQVSRAFTSTAGTTINGTKGNPCLSGDIFGDWREELILKDGNFLRIFATSSTTTYRITTLMHDPQYRNQVAGQNICYNQPPHPSFYLGSEKPLPARPNVTVNDGGQQQIIEPLDGTLIRNLLRFDAENYADWSIQYNPKVGDEMYGDRAYTFAALPPELAAAEWIRTAADSKTFPNNMAEFTAGDNISVYVALDTRVDAAAPAWLGGWTKTGMTSSASTGETFVIYKKDFASGAKVTLGVNSNSTSSITYNVFVLKNTPIVTTTPATTIAAATTTTPKATTAAATTTTPKATTAAATTTTPNATTAAATTTTAKQFLPLDGILIKNLDIKDTARYDSWSIRYNPKTGEEIYGDRAFTFTSLPAALADSEWIRMAADSKNLQADVATFNAAKDITVYIGLDSRVNLENVPWMAGWTKTDMTAETSNAAIPEYHYEIYERDFASGAAVTLGTNGNPYNVIMYTVFVLEKSANTTTTPTITTTAGTATTPAVTVTVPSTTTAPNTATTPKSATTTSDTATTPKSSTATSGTATTPKSSTATSDTATTPKSSTATSDTATTPKSTTTNPNTATTPKSATTASETATNPATTASHGITTAPATTTEPPTSADCGDCDKAVCDYCSENGKWYALGDVDGKDNVTIFDALEILKHLVGMDCTILDDEGARKAAIITGESLDKNAPSIFDALEVLKKLVNMHSRIDGVHIHGVREE